MQNNYTHEKQSLITFESKTQVATLKERIKSVKEASYSTVLTLAAFILHHMPEVPPPTIGEFEQPDFEQEEQFPPVHMTYNQLYQPWCDYLTDLYVRGKVQVNGDTHHFKTLVKNKFIAKLDINFFNITQKQTSQAGTVEQNKAGKAQKKKGKRIGVVNFATSQLRKDKIQPKMHIGGLFTGIFFSEGDQWKIFNVLAKKYPTEQQYMKLDTLILSGSSLYINEQPQEVAMFLESLRKGIQLNPKLKILGICFGHQALTKLFGGKIDQNDKLQEGTEFVTFDQKLLAKVPYFRENAKIEDNTFEVTQFHTDYVTKVPENFEVLAQSQSCQVESLVSKNRKYLSFQFHPQYSAEYIKGFELRTVNYEDNAEVQQKEDDYSQEEGFGAKHMDSLEEIRIAIRNFIDWEVEVVPQV